LEGRCFAVESVDAAVAAHGDGALVPQVRPGQLFDRAGADVDCEEPATVLILEADAPVVGGAAVDGRDDVEAAVRSDGAAGELPGEVAGLVPQQPGELGDVRPRVRARVVRLDAV